MPLLPAAAKITAPLFQAYVTASWITPGLSRTAPRFHLIAHAPVSAAQTRPFAAPENEPEPLSQGTLAFSRLALYATPTTPTPLFAFAATVPATSVPWP